MNKSYTETLAEFAAKISFDDLPEDTVHAAKRLILDTVACAIGGYSNNMGKIVAEVKKELGGKPESTIMGLGEKTSCTSAAYVNAELANDMDADDTSLKGHHANTAVMPALAVAERVGASGKQFITAVALGFDLAIRVAYSMSPPVRPNPDGTGRVEFAPTAGFSWVVFGAAVGAGSLLKLDADRMAHAMGIAGYSTSVPAAGKWGPSPAPRPMTKYAFYGPIAEAGVTAALLAERGFQGDRTVLDGDRGFWRMAGASGCDWEALTANLGQRWFAKETSYKPYPCCRYINGPLDMFLKIMRENQLHPEDVDGIKVGMNSITKHQHFEDITVLNEVDSQFSVPYIFGVAALGIDPGPEWQSPARWQDPRVMSFARKVKVYVDPDADRVYAEQVMSGGERKKMHSKVEVKAGGKAFKAQTDYAKGDPWLPEYVMSDDEMKQKFRNFSYRLLRPDNIEKAIDTIYALDNVACVDELVCYLR